MINMIYKLLLCLSLSLLGACSQVEQHLAENSYQEALASKEAKSIVAALKALTLIAPEKYLGKFESAQVAITQMQKAQSYMAEGDLYIAYLASHESYRALPTIGSKTTLIEIGTKLRYVIDVNTNVVASFESQPQKIPDLLLKYQNLPVLEWDIIETNAVIEQLGKSAKLLKRSLVAIERAEESNSVAEISKWKIGIDNQLEMIKKTQQHLINIALYGGASLLERLNVQLTEDSINLLSLVRENLAEAAMRPYFIQAQKEYEPYANLAVNLSLASSTTQRNTHAQWYQHWSLIETQVLEGDNSFSDYPKLFSNRATQLRLFKEEAQKIVPDLNRGFSSLSLFMDEYNIMYALIEKLNEDQMILNYGSSAS